MYVTDDAGLMSELVLEAAPAPTPDPEYEQSSQVQLSSPRSKGRGDKDAPFAAVSHGSEQRGTNERIIDPEA